jgi:hypothetical protein
MLFSDFSWLRFLRICEIRGVHDGLTTSSRPRHRERVFRGVRSVWCLEGDTLSVFWLIDAVLNCRVKINAYPTAAWLWTKRFI